MLGIRPVLPRLGCEMQRHDSSSCCTRRGWPAALDFAATQGDGERRPPFGIVVALDGATMRLDDRPCNREAYAEPVRFRRDEWCEQGAVDLRQARPSIAHREFES